jgi:MoaA/NifB/PqqE/SkfB family radical SAM enzyme
MLSLFDCLSQSTLQVSRRCQLRCLHCTLWNDDQILKENADFDFAIEQQFVHKNAISEKKSRVVNLIGGEPLLSPHLIQVLNTLKEEGRKIYLWTNGQLIRDLMPLVIPFVDTVFVYVPYSDVNGYRVETGSNAFPELTDTISMLRQEGKQVVIHSVVRADNIQFLPDMYELAYQKKAGLILQYNKKDFYEKESLNYIRRYYHVKNVWVFENKKVLERSCSGLPILSFKDPIQIVKNTFYDFINDCRHKAGM